ncbi:C-terminal binding protein [Rhodobacteraceae bacterium LMO-12]|nr:C-terminal binding protein [Rhodobacteraceae bacterium LMO-JJ12]
MAKKIVAIADTVFPDLEPARQAMASVGAEMHTAEKPTPEAILAVAAEADGLFVTYGKITAEVIQGMKKCKVIGRFGIGVDNIDIAAATAAGIVVTYVPDYCFDEVSDHTMALLLDLARKTSQSNALVQSGRWEMPAVVPLHRLRGRTMGLVGFGNIPRLVAQKAKAFGLNVIVSDPYISDEVVTAAGVERVEFDDLLGRSDYVSLHAPLTPATTGLLNAAAFGKLKPGALLINTARGPLVDTDDLVKALDSGRIGGAGLDVVAVEPLPENSALLGRDNVILTPHTGFYSEDALLDLQTKCAQDVAAVLQGKRPIYPINPEVLG